jgi:hypothetical protein
MPLQEQGRPADAAGIPYRPLSGARIPMDTRAFVNTRIQLAGLALACMLARGAKGQAPSRPTTTVSPVGSWRGMSLCAVRPSACHDEVVVYRITQMEAADRLAIDARKIIRGEEQEMGVLGCRLVSPTGLTCVVPQGVWQFSVRKDSLTGELRLKDNTRYRQVRTSRTP